MKLLIPVPAGIEQITKRQLFSLGYEKAPADNGRIEVEGDWQDIARLNVLLRSGERVLIVWINSKRRPLTSCLKASTLSPGKTG